MEIKGKVHCFFEQSGTFKNEFKKLGIDAEDYDIQNNFGETDHVVDLFNEIDKAYGGGQSLFDSITKDDLIVAFFPCIHFCGISQTMFGINEKNYKNMTNKQKFDYIINKSNLRTEFFNMLNKFVFICIENGLRMVFENPWAGQQFLRVFLKQPDIVDENRMLRGDYMVKPTAYWFWNCEPTKGFSYQCDKEQRHPIGMRKNPVAGQCSEERSMISADYARNWICDFILGKKQEIGQLSLF